jgi:nucleotide-binding universal stress UspA family protein
MSNGTNGHRQLVLVGVDGTGDGLRALHFAVEEAARRAASLRIVHVQQEFVPLDPMLPLVPEAALHEVATGILEEAERQARLYGYTDPSLDPVLCTGPRIPALVVQAADADCIVMGRRSTDVAHLLTGSTTCALAEHAHAPVICVPDTWEPLVHHGVVVAGIDGSHLAFQTVDVALAEARIRGARLVIVHAWRPSGHYDAALDSDKLSRDWTRSTQVTLTRWMNQLHPGSDDEWSVVTAYEAPALALHQRTRHADLLVLGRHGSRGPFAPSLGSVARALLRAGECPVMILPTSSPAD